MLCKKKGISKAKLSEKMGVDYSTVYRWGINKNSPKDEHLEELARIFDVSIAYLKGWTDNPESNETGIPAPSAEVEVTTTARPNAREGSGLDKHLRAVSSAGMAVTPVPVVTKEIKVCCGNVYPAEVEWELSGEYCFIYDKDLIGYSWQCDSFRVIVAEGDSMEPRIHDGDYLAFALGAQAGTGDVAVVRHEGRLMVRGLSFSPNGVITMHPFNKSYRDKIVEKEEEFYILGVVVGKAPQPGLQPIGGVF